MKQKQEFYISGINKLLVHNGFTREIKTERVKDGYLIKLFCCVGGGALNLYLAKDKTCLIINFYRGLKLIVNIILDGAIGIKESFIT